MNTLKMCYSRLCLQLQLGLTLMLLITMIIQYYVRIIMHYKYKYYKYDAIGLYMHASSVTEICMCQYAKALHMANGFVHSELMFSLLLSFPFTCFCPQYVVFDTSSDFNSCWSSWLNKTFSISQIFH